jgi:pyruvate ferredoxin oxidoreductase gamma subunit
MQETTALDEPAVPGGGLIERATLEVTAHDHGAAAVLKDHLPRGARVHVTFVSFCRIDDRAIRLREPITEPDALIVQDPTLLHQVNLFGGLRPDGFLLVNTSRGLDELGLEDLVESLPRGHVVAVPATEMARRHLGRPLPNAALLGGFAALTGQVSLEAVVGAIRSRFAGAVGEGNAEAATAAYDHVHQVMKEMADA